MAGGLDKKYVLSDELAEFMDSDTAKRTDVNKELWKYIKKHDLQNPKNRRQIVPDDVLAELFGTKPFSMFEMATKLKKHFK